MNETIASLSKKALSENMEESVQGIELLIRVVDEATETLLKAIEVSSDRLIAVEKVSLVFHSYLTNLGDYLTSSDKGMAFWAASLIMHYQVKSPIAERILLDAINQGEESSAITATTILCRTKNENVKPAILERLKDRALIGEVREFFREKLRYLDDEKGGGNPI